METVNRGIREEKKELETLSVGPKILNNSWWVDTKGENLDTNNGEQERGREKTEGEREREKEIERERKIKKITTRYFIFYLDLL